MRRTKVVLGACVVGLVLPIVARSSDPPAPPPAVGEVQEQGGECRGEVPTEALAIVDGVVIPRAKVDASIAGPLAEVRKYLDDARRQALYLEINARLLDQEARRRGVDARQVLEEEMVSVVQDPTEAEALAFFEANRAGIQGEFAESKGEIVKHLRRAREGERAKELADRLRAGAEVRVLVEERGALAEERAPEFVLATVNGSKITSGEIDRSLGPTLANADEKIHELRREALDRCIDEMLVEKETRRRRTTVQGLLAAEVRSRTKRVDEKDVLRFYESNRSRLGLDLSKAEDRVRVVRHLQKLEEDRSLAAFLDQLRGNASVQILLSAPRHPVEVLAGEDQPVLGDPAAPVTIVVFVDYECETCADLHGVLRELLDAYSGKIQVVARDLPLDAHPHAYEAALAAEAAREQGRYWEYIAVLFQERDGLDRDHLKEYASRVGLDRRKFDEALDTEKFADRVLGDRADAHSLGLASTPNVFVDGRRIEDKTRPSLVAAIESALAERAAR